MDSLLHRESTEKKLKFSLSKNLGYWEFFGILTIEDETSKESKSKRERKRKMKYKKGERERARNEDEM